MNQPIRCPKCRQTIPVSDINMDRMVARCLSCNNLFDPSDQVEPSRRNRPKIERPSGIKVTKRGTELEISRRWFSFVYVFLTVWCLIWDGALVGFYVSIFSQEHIQIGEALFPSLHLIAGIGVTYWTVCGYVNSTRVEVKRGRVSVTHGPLKWPGNTSVESRDIDQIFVIQKIGNKGSRTYGVCALMKDGTKIELLRGLPDSNQATFIEQALEEHLKIEDRAVEGEHV